MILLPLSNDRFLFSYSFIFLSEPSELYTLGSSGLLVEKIVLAWQPFLLKDTKLLTWETKHVFSLLICSFLQYLKILPSELLQRCFDFFFLAFLCTIHIVTSYRYSLTALMAVGDYISLSGHTVAFSTTAYEQCSLWLSTNTQLGQRLPILFMHLFLAHRAVIVLFQLPVYK